MMEGECRRSLERPKSLEDEGRAWSYESGSPTLGSPEDLGLIQSLIHDSKENICKEGVQGLKQKLFSKGSRLVLSSQVWLHALPTYSCDLLLTLPPGHPQAQTVIPWLIDQIRSKEPRLKVEVRYHAQSDSYGLYFTARYDSLLKGAELLQLKKRLRNGGMRDFVYDEAELFSRVEVKRQFLTSQERSAVIKMFLKGVRAGDGGETLLQEDGAVLLRFREGQVLVSSLICKGLASNIQPLHEGEQLKGLRDTWVMSLAPQPIEQVREYFGTQIAMYFAWLGHYTKALWFPATFGFLMWWWGLSASRKETERGQLISDICFVLFALLNCLWATIYLEAWKRRQAELSYQWGTLGMDQDLLEEPRSDFEGELQRSPITGHLELFYPVWKRRLIRYGISYPVTVFCILLMFCLMLAIFELQEWCNRKFADINGLSWLTVLPKVLLGVVVCLSDERYMKLAVYLNDLENYRSEEAYENNLIIKIVMFQFVNSFLALFYIAFYLQDMSRLSAQLAALLITRQVIGNFTEAGLPYLTEKWKLSQMAYQMTRSMSDASLERHVTRLQEHRRSLAEVGHQLSGDEWSPIADDGSVISLPCESTELRQRKAPPRKQTRLPLPEFRVTGPQLTQAELESLLPKYTSPLEDYLEMFIQFGYVLLFSPAFPLAAVCALLNNLLEIRVDAFKLCNTLQRPFARRVENIGAWMPAMELMTVVGVMVNCALIGQSGLVQRLWPDLSWGGQILIVVVLEHLVLALKFVIALAIPDVPHWVTVQMAKIEFQRREALKREVRMASSEHRLLEASGAEEEAPMHLQTPTARYRSLTPIGTGRRDSSPGGPERRRKPRLIKVTNL